MAYKKIKKGRLMGWASKVGDMADSGKKIIDKGKEIAHKGKAMYEDIQEDQYRSREKAIKRLNQSSRMLNAKAKNKKLKEQARTKSKWDWD